MTTDRSGRGKNLAESDIHDKHWLQIRNQFSPPRSLEPNHTASTKTSTSWVRLLNHPDVTPSELRSHLLKPRFSTGIPPQFRDFMYRVQMDALPIGVRCPKKTNKGLCDLCWYLDGTPQTESIQHLLLDCPYAAPGLNAHRAFLLATCSLAGKRSILSMNKAAFIATFTGRMVFGSTVAEDAI
jgi:hypothetical protein